MPGYAFPVLNYPKGKIALHWNVSPNAADLFAKPGTPIQAVVSGRVTDASWDDTGGWVVYYIGDADTKALHYYNAHMLERPPVVIGQRLTVGQQIGKVGDTGNAKGKGAHLHLGIGLDIKNGSGPEGGAGVPWPGNNCNKYLQFILDTIGSGSVTPPPPPPETDYEVVARYLTDQNGPILVALRDRKSALLKHAAALTIEAGEIDNVINEIIRNRPT